MAAHIAAAMSGEVDASPRRRAEYATDASNYRVMPAVVAYPRDADDLEAGLAAAREAGVPVTMRGGGTSVAGNSIESPRLLLASASATRSAPASSSTRRAT